jgi:hypothetical protein
MLEIKNLFEMKYEDLIKMFYKSDYYIIFKNKEKTKYNDEETKKQEGFKISGVNGFLKILKRKRKRD